MKTRICLGVCSLTCPESGGHLWVYLNWVLGLRALGCEIIWLEAVPAGMTTGELETQASLLKKQLAKFDLEKSLAFYPLREGIAAAVAGAATVPLEEAYSSDLLLNLAYDGFPSDCIRRFRRKAAVDIDPGLTQVWMSKNLMKVAPHDLYFTIGETVGRAGAVFPDCGIRWQYTPPPIFLDAWPVTGAQPGAPYTTVTNWWGQWFEFGGKAYSNGKRFGFEPLLDLPRRSKRPLELAICLGNDGAEERKKLERHGWSVRSSEEVAGSPEDYQRYIRGSRGEFSCAKPSCIQLQNAWISDRTLCYLASGKPAIVQHTGPSRFLPDDAGLFRFRDLEEAARSLEKASVDYERQSQLARALAEERFDARKVLGCVLEKSMG